MIFFSCRFAPNRWSISIKDNLPCACGARLGKLRPRRFLSHLLFLSLRSKPLEHFHQR
jgi:hypothetical protein